MTPSLNAGAASSTGVSPDSSEDHSTSGSLSDFNYDTTSVDSWHYSSKSSDTGTTYSVPSESDAVCSDYRQQMEDRTTQRQLALEALEGKRQNESPDTTPRVEICDSSNNHHDQTTNDVARTEFAKMKISSLKKSEFAFPHQGETRAVPSLYRKVANLFPGEGLKLTTPQAAKRNAIGLSDTELFDRLEMTCKPPLLIIDLRSLNTYLGPAGRFAQSVNVAFPSLLIKRFKRGNTSNFQLSSFITTETGKHTYQTITNSGSPVDTILVSQPQDFNSGSMNPASVLLSVLERKEEQGSLYFLNKPFPLRTNPLWKEYIVESEDGAESSSPDDLSSPESLSTDSDGGGHKYSSFNLPLSPSQSQTFIRPSFNHNRRTSPINDDSLGAPTLCRIDTSDNLLDLQRPKLKSSPKPIRTGLSIDPSMARGLTVTLSAHPSKSPRSPSFGYPAVDVDLPMTARPGGGRGFQEYPTSPVEDTEDFPFEVAEILPGFLYLGPEPTTEEDFLQLEQLGVKQILNMALECDDSARVQNRFEKYFKIPMRDFVEETGVQKSISEACRIIADAQLRSKPIYCHCRAGKSRSVTVILAYLVHRNHWSLKRAYSHVASRRRGISPNIGFVAELMKWEEKERGCKSSGVFGAHSSAELDAITPITSRQPSFTNPSPCLRTPSSPYASQVSDEEKDEDHNWIRNCRVRDSLPVPSRAAEHTDRVLEVRSPRDGRWVAAKVGQFDLNHVPSRRASRAGLESDSPV